MIRWGMIGCGDVTEIKSAPAFNIIGRSKIVAVQSRTISKATDYAARHGVPRVFETADELIHSAEVDGVYIATPPSSHLELALQVAKAGKPCCVEKPIALNHAQAMEMTEAFEQAGAPLFISYYRRTLPQFEQVKTWLAMDRIGKVRHVQWSLHRAPTPSDLAKTGAWRTDPSEAPGGYFDDLACHGLDLFDYFFGPINKARGLSRNQQGLYDVPDTVTGHWLHEGGVTGSGFWNFASINGPDRVEIYGEKGRIAFSVFGETPLICESEGGVETLEIKNPDPVQKFHVEQMVACLEGQSSHPSTGESAARTQWVCDQILGLPATA